MDPGAGRDSQGPLPTSLCPHCVLAAGPLLWFLKPALQGQTGAVLD